MLNKAYSSASLGYFGLLISKKLLMRMEKRFQLISLNPNPFKCRITVRNEDIRKTIEREGQQALGDLSIYNGETKYRMSTYKGLK